MKFKLYESPSGNQNLLIFQRGPLIGEYFTMDEVNSKIKALAEAYDGVDKFDSEEWPIISGTTEAIYFIHTRLFKGNKIETLGHILTIVKLDNEQ